MPVQEFKCRGCGGPLVYKPGTTSLSCAHCGGHQAIPASQIAIAESDFVTAMRAFDRDAPLVERVTVNCKSCGAHVEFAENVTSARCPFCGTPQVAEKASTKQIRPTAILPFGIDKDASRGAYTKWLGGLWWAPNDLAKMAVLDGALQGVYIPFYTFDAVASTHYTGQRGVDYWDTEHYTVVVNGKSQRRSRQVRKTRWYPARGHVTSHFDDVLVIATASLPTNRLATLEPWDLKNLTAYTDEFVSGFSSETYALSLVDGFKVAQTLFQPTIDMHIRHDIGGDRQIISSKSSDYQAITYKHILLPVWVAAYRYHGKVYQILINARTGELSGDRPYSWVKITLAAFGVLALLVVIAVLISLQTRH